MSKCIKGALQEEEGKRGKDGMIVGCDKEFEDHDIDNALSIMHTGLCQECNFNMHDMEHAKGIHWSRSKGMYEPFVKEEKK
jgi:hypothetical protein